MKRTTLFIVAIFTILTVAGQSPKKFNYQAVIRDNAHQLIKNSDVELEISIRYGSESGSVVFTETHDVTTNEIGLVSLRIGSIEVTDFDLIDWSDGPYFLQITADGTALPAEQLLSVPYAEYADQAGNVPDPQQLSIASDIVSLTDGGEIVLPDASDRNEFQVLAMNLDTIFLENEATEETSYVILPPGDYNELLNVPDMDYYRTIVAYVGGNMSTALTTTDAVVRSVTITVPVAGIIEVDAVGYAYFTGSGRDGYRVSITTSTNAVDYNYLQIGTDYGSTVTFDNDYQPFSASRIYEVNAGEYTFNLVGDIFASGMVVSIGDVGIKAVFHPDPPSAKKAAYPPISEQEMSLEESERRSKLGITGN